MNIRLLSPLVSSAAIPAAPLPPSGLRRRLAVAGLVIAGALPLGLRAADDPSFTRVRDVIYGRSFGASLTMDVFKPTQPSNGLGVILVISGAWISNLEQFNPRIKQIVPLTQRGYTVFGVVHRSQPRYTIPEMLDDLNRSVRYIRLHARDYGINPNALGIYGASSGGHLALMQAMAGDLGKADAKDAVERTSSRIQAVAVLRPPTDFVNYGHPGEIAYGSGLLQAYNSIFRFLEPDPTTKGLTPITDPAKIKAIAQAVSPASHVTPDDPPTLIIHGAVDKLVPIQQAELLVEKLHAVGVEAKLIPKPGIGHGTFPHQEKDIGVLADWFDTHLKKIAR
jgi:acetyl esterase/lipase